MLCSEGSGPYQANLGSFSGILFWGGFVLGAPSHLFPNGCGLPGRLWDVLCSLCMQGSADRRTKVLKVWATEGKEGCQGQVRGFRAAQSQFEGLFRVYYIPTFPLLMWAAGPVVGCVVLFMHTKGHQKEGKRSHSRGYQGHGGVSRASCGF